MNRVVLLLTVLLGFGTQLPWARSQERPEVEYKFLVIEFVFSDQGAKTDPQAFYDVKLQSLRDRSTHTGGLPYSKLQSLMKHFGVNSPAGLIGKSFSTRLSPSEGIEKIHQAQNLQPPQVDPPQGAAKEGPAVSGQRDKRLPLHVSPATSDQDPRLSAGQAD